MRSDISAGYVHVNMQVYHTTSCSIKILVELAQLYHVLDETQNSAYSLLHVHFWQYLHRRWDIQNSDSERVTDILA